MLSLISLFLRFPSYFPQNSGQQKYKAYLFKLSSHLIVERHLPTIASDAYGIGFVEETRTTRDQYCGCICGTRDHIFNIHSVQLSYSCLELRLDRIWWYSPGCMVRVLMSVGVMRVGEITVGVMTRSNETTPELHRRLCNDTDKGVTKNILTKFSINKWPSSVSIKVRLSL
jgi:hypothetical protein